MLGVMGDRGKGWRSLAGLSCCCVLALTGCGPLGHAADGRIGVVAGENVWGNIAAQLGGDRVAVTSLINDPGTDPHEYESDVHAAAAVADANVVIENGLGYDDFLTKLLSASPGNERTVLTVSAAAGVKADNANPHLWYGPGFVIAAARAIEGAFAKASPADAGRFRAHLRTFLAGEQRVVSVLHQIKAKYAGSAIAYTERVPGYLLAAAGLRLGVPASFPQAIEDGTDPSPRDNAAFEKALTGHRVKALIYNSQVTDPVTKQLRDLATTSGIPVVDMTETLPPTEPDYQTWQADQARALLAALGG
jgi:zinc/manganese transport system substrate-binding protein